MGKLQKMRAAKKAAKENKERELDKLDRHLCQVFAQVESASGSSGGTRPAQQKTEKDAFAKYPGGFMPSYNHQTVSRDSAAAARDRMEQRLSGE